MSATLCVSEESMTIIRKLERALATVTPYCCTMDGKSGVTSDSLFCTSTCARSSLVSGVKVSVTVPRPLESADVDM